MRKGDINIDWILALFIFLAFLSWSFQYYASASKTRGVQIDEVAEGIVNTILGNLTRDVYELPVTYNSPAAMSNSVMYANYYWNSDGEKNTTMVLSNTSSQLVCRISGSAVYWRANVAGGSNNFTIRVSNRTAAAMNCSGTFDLTGANLTLPRSADRKNMLSQAAIDVMSSMGYDVFRSGLGINRNFRLVFDAGGAGSAAYGSALPNTAGVFSDRRWFRVEENSTNVNVTVMVW